MQTNSNTVPVNPEKDQNARSLDLMNRMRLHGMAAAFTESLHSTTAEAMTPDNFLSWLLSREWDYRSAAAIQRLIRGASFRYKAFPEEIDYTIPRGLDPTRWSVCAVLTSSDRVRTCSSQVHPIQAKASLPRRWATMPATTAYVPATRTHPNCLDFLKWPRTKERSRPSSRK